MKSVVHNSNTFLLNLTDGERAAAMHASYAATAKIYARLRCRHLARYHGRRSLYWFQAWLNSRPRTSPEKTA
ncbi:MAG: hypothetical protein Kow00114_27400 [Kiloniellaceae bacterium]